MREFVVVAPFEIKNGSPDDLLRAALVEAEAVLRNEEGCRAFDILESEEGRHKGPVL